MSTRSVSKLSKGWAASRTRATNLAKKLADPTRKIGSTALGAVGGAGSGYLHKWAATNGKDITLGDSKVTYGMVAGGALALVGATMGGKKGMTEGAYAAHGLGTGILAGELALLVANG